MSLGRALICAGVRLTPNDESWVVQGIVDSTTGLPASLDGRLSSGTPLDPSRANIVLRDIRFTGRVAPLDAHPEFRRAPFVTGRIGAAFQYTGGSADPENLARLHFERLIFDHNHADTAAVFIDGQAGRPVPADPSRQNWQSGISWVVRGSTFYRNFGTAFGASVSYLEVWPMEVVFEGNDYIQNQAPIVEQLGGGYMMYPGAERRIGFSSVRFTSCHFDGGSEAEGLVTSMHPSIVFTYDENDDPHAIINATFDRTTYVDHETTVFGIAMAVQAWPAQADHLRQLNARLTDFEMHGTHNRMPGSGFDASYVMVAGAVKIVVERSRFDHNGIFESESGGTGGFRLEWPDSVVQPHTASFIGTEWAVRWIQHLAKGSLRI